MTPIQGIQGIKDIKIEKRISLTCTTSYRSYWATLKSKPILDVYTGWRKTQFSHYVFLR